MAKIDLKSLHGEIRARSLVREYIVEIAAKAGCLNSANPYSQFDWATENIFNVARLSEQDKASCAKAVLKRASNHERLTGRDCV